MNAEMLDTPTPPGASLNPVHPAEQRLQVLDGWRGISISLVLMGHLLPLGPKALRLNETAGIAGMAVFFILSGFLITSLLLRDAHIGRFLVRRFARIVPLAWLALVLVFWAEEGDSAALIRNLLFIANWPPMALPEGTTHFWSLCVEVQFYIGVAVLVGLLGKRGLWLLPVLAVAVTLWRVAHGKELSIETQFRVDEILAGCMLALMHHHRQRLPVALLGKIPAVLAIALFLIACHPASGWLGYVRPYLAMVMIASTLFALQHGRFHRWLEGRVLGYLASVSYALYVIHGCLHITWLESGDKLEKYLKRPLFFAVTFALAHLSTFYFERFFNEWGRRLTARRPSTPP
jgi:peptidoglycan/LPS O-acetylase OafA/YrhL